MDKYIVKIELIYVFMGEYRVQQPVRIQEIRIDHIARAHTKQK